MGAQVREGWMRRKTRGIDGFAIPPAHPMSGELSLDVGPASRRAGTGRYVITAMARRGRERQEHQRLGDMVHGNDVAPFLLCERADSGLRKGAIVPEHACRRLHAQLRMTDHD